MSERMSVHATLLTWVADLFDAWPVTDDPACPKPVRILTYWRTMVGYMLDAADPSLPVAERASKAQRLATMGTHLAALMDEEYAVDAAAAHSRAAWYAELVVSQAREQDVEPFADLDLSDSCAVAIRFMSLACRYFTYLIQLAEPEFADYPEETAITDKSVRVQVVYLAALSYMLFEILDVKES